MITNGKAIKKETLLDPNWCLTMLSSLLSDTSTHDVTFKTSDGGSVSGHKLIVGAGSPVFHAMLYGKLKESSEREIKLPSINTESFKALLSFMYTGMISIDSENCLDILDAAHYFNVATLEVKCAEFIDTLLNIDNCFTFLTFANSKNFDVLLEKCLAFMYFHADKIIKKAHFKALPSELMLKFCQSSDLHVKEVSLFLATTEWCQHQKSNVSDDTIKSVLQQIRYPLISITDLLEKVRPTKYADAILYTLALEFHHMPSKYDGPQIQLSRRKSQLDFINLTPNNMTINEGVSISKTGSDGWNGLCAAEVYPTEKAPVHFKFSLKQSNSDRSGIQIVTRSCLQGSLSASKYGGGIDARGFTIGKEVDGVITISGNKITTTIGHKTMTSNKEYDNIYLCVYLYYSGNSVAF